MKHFLYNNINITTNDNYSIRRLNLYFIINVFLHGNFLQCIFIAINNTKFWKTMINQNFRWKTKSKVYLVGNGEF